MIISIVYKWYSVVQIYITRLLSCVLLFVNNTHYSNSDKKTSFLQGSKMKSLIGNNLVTNVCIERRLFLNFLVLDIIKGVKPFQFVYLITFL